MSGHVITVSNFYPPRSVGGAEVVAHRQALLLRNLGWAVSVFAGVLPSDAFPEGTIHVEQVGGIEVTLLALHSLDPDDNFRWPLADNVLRAMIARVRPSWIHAHNITGLGLDLVAVAHDAGVPVAVTLHDNWGYCLQQTRLRTDGSLCRDTDECHLCKLDIRAGGTRLPIRLRKDYVAHRLQQADLLISPSDDLARRYAEDGFRPGSIQVQSNGIDLAQVPSRFRERRPKLQFVCTAYLGAHKGIPVLLDALRHLHADPGLKGRWSLTIAGHGQLSGLVEDTIAVEGWNNIAFVGRRPRQDIMELILDSDVAILPSIWPENEPVVLLEAAASGAALIASKLGGNIALVRDGTGGLLFEPGDAKTLAAAMRQMVTDPRLLERFSRANLAMRGSLDEERTGARLHAWFSGTRPAAPATGPVLICAGGHSVQSTLMLSLFAKLVPGVRLIWHEWARPADWDAARGFWHWSEPNVSDLQPALQRGLPIVAPDTPLVRRLCAPGGPPIQRYADLQAFWPMVAELCGGSAPPLAGHPSSIGRFLVQLHDIAHFARAT